LLRAACAVRAIGITSLPISLARIQHGQTKQKLTIPAHDYNKEKCSGYDSPTVIFLKKEFDVNAGAVQAIKKSL
jgi:hypothetical protein